jgi:hypothetical protein
MVTQQGKRVERESANLEMGGEAQNPKLKVPKNFQRGEDDDENEDDYERQG